MEINLKLTSYPEIKEAYTLVANINNKNIYVHILLAKVKWILVT